MEKYVFSPKKSFTLSLPDSAKQLKLKVKNKSVIEISYYFSPNIDFPLNISKMKIEINLKTSGASVSFASTDALIRDLKDQANAANLAGYSDWRIPNRRELS